MIKLDTDKILTARPWTVTCDVCGDVIPGKYSEVKENGNDVHKCWKCAFAKK